MVSTGNLANVRQWWRERARRRRGERGRLMAGCKWVAKHQGKEERKEGRKEGGRICGWKERGRKRWREIQKHSLGADREQLLIGVSVCARVCTCTEHWLWLPRLPALLEKPAVVMCCDRGWFLWLTALAGELLCHANEQMRRWAGLTANQRVTPMTLHGLKKEVFRWSIWRHKKMPISSACTAPDRHLRAQITTCKGSVTEVATHGQTKKPKTQQQHLKSRSMIILHTNTGRVGVTLFLHCVPLHQRNP